VTSYLPSHPTSLYQSGRTILKTFFRFYFRNIIILEQENLPIQGPCILAPKHFSRWDPPILSQLSAEPLRYMTNANQFSGIQGWFIQRLGAFPVDLSQPRISNLRQAIDLLHDRQKLVIFPEGGIVRDQPLRNLRPGLARLTLQAETTAPGKLAIPIIPIGLSYFPTASPRATVIIHINTAIYSQQHQQGHAKQTANHLTKALQNSILESLNIINDFSRTN
jgi:1-acyl-sn-glycerol-3-phosphate acyltransferase